MRQIAGERGMRAGALALALAAGGGCSEQNTYVEPPPAEGDAWRVPLVDRASPTYLEFTGTTAASEHGSEVRARVPGGAAQRCTSIPGTAVEAGALLFTIDPKEYEADLMAAEAEVASAESQAERAETEFARAERLFKQPGGLRRRGGEVARRARAGAAAEARRGAPSRPRAKLNLGYTEVVEAPIGRDGSGAQPCRRRQPGGRGRGDGPHRDHRAVRPDVRLLQPERARPAARARALPQAREGRRAIDPNGRQPDAKPEIALELGLANETGYPARRASARLRGVRQSTPAPGRCAARPLRQPRGDRRDCCPGLFTRVRMPIDRSAHGHAAGRRAGARLGPDRALRADRRRRRSKVEKRAVVASASWIDGMRVVESGSSRRRPGRRERPPAGPPGRGGRRRDRSTWRRSATICRRSSRGEPRRRRRPGGAGGG